MKERRIFIVLVLVFLAAYFIPFSRLNVQNALMEVFLMVQEYARRHVLLCLIPAFFIAGAFMYFATLTEVPILQGLLGSGMGQGPALGLLLAGPALSLPSMLVIRSVLGTKKTVVYTLLVVVMATITGILFWNDRRLSI
jgi:uncharacterized membrane protein YraQ (UPF0718 family)